LRATSSIDPFATARDGRHILRAAVRQEKKPADAKPPNETLSRAVEHPSDGFVTKRRADGCVRAVNHRERGHRDRAQGKRHQKY
jgi:hypothetical protein